MVTESSTWENDLGVASWSTLKQQDAADSEFVKLDDVSMKKIWSIPEEYEELRAGPLTPKVN